MRNPLNGDLYITGYFKEKAQPGTGLSDGSGTRHHVGVDLRARTPQAVFAIDDGVVTQSYESSAGQTLEYRIEVRGRKYLVRIMHLSRRDVRVGQTIKAGQQIAMSGSSGGVAPHLHIDVRYDGTTWNASLNNYVDPLALIKGGDGFDMPAVGAKVKLRKGDVRTTFDRNGKAVGKIHAKDDTYWYYVRGINNNRILINSASGGGNNVELALYYLDGRRIDGWEVI